jgi:hypothetical protein
MKLLYTITVLLLWTACADAHPLHLSITNITYENGMLMVSMKTYRDDWETAYFHYNSKVIDFTEPAQREIPWFRNYLEKSFRLSTDKENEPFLIAVDTIMLEEAFMTIEMRAAVQGDPKSLYIYNALLIDIYPDQTNLVIFGCNDWETGIKFDIIKHDEVMMLDHDESELLK